MKKYFLYLTCILIFSCTSYAKLEIYKKGFKPNSNCINTHGYYLRTIPAHSKSLLTEHFQPIFFYADGSFICDSYYSGTNQMKKDIVMYPNQTYDWGFFKCNDTIIKSEYLHQYDITK